MDVFMFYITPESLKKGNKINKVCASNQHHPIKIDCTPALALVIDNKMTKQQYVSHKK